MGFFVSRPRVWIDGEEVSDFFVEGSIIFRGESFDLMKPVKDPALTPQSEIDSTVARMLKDAAEDRG